MTLTQSLIPGSRLEQPGLIPQVHTQSPQKDEIQGWGSGELIVLSPNPQILYLWVARREARL